MPNRSAPEVVAPALADALDEKLRILIDSFQRLTGGELLANATPESLWTAPRVIVAHGTEDDPIFFYGNALALDVFAMDFTRFTHLPSRYSAEAPRRDERARLLDRVRRDGYIDDYSGIRIAADGRRFRIEQAVVWNLIDAAGVHHGQAASFTHWTPL